MVLSSKRKMHYSCACQQCKIANTTDVGHKIKKMNEKKLRAMAKEELRKAVKETKRELEEVDVIFSIRSPRNG